MVKCLVLEDKSYALILSYGKFASLESGLSGGTFMVKENKRRNPKIIKS